MGAEVKYEGAPGGDRFPHVYGALPLDAVMAVYPLPPRADGTFEPPLACSVA